MSNASTGRKIYAVLAEELGLVKIGVAKHPLSRLTHMQTGSPAQLRLIGVSETVETPEEIERVTHLRFSHLRVRGEWFRYDAEMAAFIAGELLTPDRARPKARRSKTPAGEAALRAAQILYEREADEALSAWERGE